MIKVTALYPNTAESRFDMEYYCNQHMPMVRDSLGQALKHIEVEKITSGGAPGSQAAYLAAGHLYFESVEAFQAAFAPHADTIRGDVVNYTDIRPEVHIGEVML